jgi:hypothetical protein
MTQPEPQPATPGPATTGDHGKGPGILGSIIVAVIAIIGTVAGGAITGYYTYATTSHNTDAQRSSQLEDQRRVTYSDFLSAATAVCIDLELRMPSAEVFSVIRDMTNKESSVLLISPSHMQAPADKLDGYLNTQGQTGQGTCDGNTFITLRNAFVNDARQDFPDAY